MTKVTVTNYGSVHVEAGWHRKEVEAAGDTVEDVLLSLTIANGRRLYDLLVDEGRLRPAYTLLYNGQNVQTLKGLRTVVWPHGNIVAIDVLHLAAGGWR